MNLNKISVFLSKQFIRIHSTANQPAAYNAVIATAADSFLS